MNVQPLMGHLHHVCTYTPRLRGQHRRGWGTQEKRIGKRFLRGVIPQLGASVSGPLKRTVRHIDSPWFENKTFLRGSHTKNLIWAAADTLGYWG